MGSILFTYTELVIVPFEIRVHLVQKYCVNVHKRLFSVSILSSYTDVFVFVFFAILSFFYNLVPLQNGHTPHQHIQAKMEQFETPNLKDCAQLKQNANTFYFYVFFLCD